LEVQFTPLLLGCSVMHPPVTGGAAKTGEAVRVAAAETMKIGATRPHLIMEKRG